MAFTNDVEAVNVFETSEAQARALSKYLQRNTSVGSAEMWGILLCFTRAASV